jgi:hypothetical protein
MGEGLSTQSRSHLSYGRRETIAGSPNSRGIRHGGEHSQGVPASSTVNISSCWVKRSRRNTYGTKVATGLHEAVKDDEQRHNIDQLFVGTADNQPNNQVTTESNHHHVAPAQLVYEQCTQQHPRESNSAQQKLVLGGSNNVGVLENTADNGA